MSFPSRGTATGVTRSAFFAAAAGASMRPAFREGLGVHVAVELGMQAADRFDLCG